MAGSLYYGDNLKVLRESIRDESVDLIYLDPPFNSNATYNVLFKAPSGQQSRAQIEAFEDTWHWGTEAETAFLEVLQNPRYPDAGAMLQAMRTFLRENDMMAYLAMMAVRMIELHRVLKPNGNLYLHCDPTASHYLKILLDAVFGPDGFRNEIIWERSKNPKGSQHEGRRWGSSTDSILFYGKSDTATLNVEAAKRLATPEEIERIFPNDDERGRWADGPILRSDSMGLRPNLVYDYKGFIPGPAGWRMELEKLKEIDRDGNLYWTSEGRPRRKLRPTGNERFPLSNCWTDISPVNSQARERLGYPTQKPLSLLERILNASTSHADTVLDPFCGCGTAVHAAEKLGRNWIGIDVTHLAISLVERRLRDAFPGVKFDVHGTPKDIEGARDLARRDKYQFQWWAVSLVDAVPYGGKKRGADSGIDGWRYMASGRSTVARAIVSVKGGEHVSAPMVRDLRGVMERERAEAGLFITLAEPTKPMLEEAAKAGLFESAFGGKRHQRLQIVTVESLLNGVKPDLPPLAIEAGFRRAEKEDRTERDQGSLLAAGGLDAPVVAVPRRGGRRGLQSRSA